MKATGIVIIAVVALAMVFIAGCTSQAPTYDDPDKAAKALKEKQADAAQAAAMLAAKVKAAELDSPYVFSHEATSGKYGNAEITGIIYNPTDRMVKVFGYVDYYQNGVKVDDGIFSCTPDAHGKATFKSSSFDVDGKYTYTIRITNVYKA